MKLIRQISTGKTVFREEPHHEKALVNGSLFTGIDASDLEVHTHDFTEDQYEKLLQDETPYLEKRKKSYPPLGDQLDALWKGGDDATAMKVIIEKVKSDYPKE